MGHCDPSVQRPRPGAQIFDMPEEQKSLFLRCIRVPKVEVGGLGRSFSPQWGFSATHHPPCLGQNTSPAEPPSIFLSGHWKAGLCVLAEAGQHSSSHRLFFNLSAKNKQSSSVCKESSCAPVVFSVLMEHEECLLPLPNSDVENSLWSSFV